MERIHTTQHASHSIFSFSLHMVCMCLHTHYRNSYALQKQWVSSLIKVKCPESVLHVKMCILQTLFALKLGQDLSLCKQHDFPSPLILVTLMALTSFICSFPFLKHKKAISQKKIQITYFAILSLHFFASNRSKNLSFLIKAFSDNSS